MSSFSFTIIVVFNAVLIHGLPQWIPQQNQQFLGGNFNLVTPQRSQDAILGNSDAVFSSQPVANLKTWQQTSQSAVPLQVQRGTPDVKISDFTNSRTFPSTADLGTQFTFVPVQKQRLQESNVNVIDDSGILPRQQPAPVANFPQPVEDIVTERPRPQLTAPVPTTPPQPTKAPASSKVNSTVTASGNKTVSEGSTSTLRLAGFEPYVSAGVAALGAAIGKAECELKAACLAASLIPNIQGRDLAIVAAERFIPEAWKPAYIAAKSSIIQGTSCTQYNCTI